MESVNSMTAGLFLVIAAYPSWWYRLSTIVEWKNGCVGRREEGARWKWKFCHREAERVLEEKKVRAAAPHWGGVMSWGLIIWGSESFFSRRPYLWGFRATGLNVSSEVFAFAFTWSPGITTGLGALFMFVSPCGGSWTTPGRMNLDPRSMRGVPWL